MAEDSDCQFVDDIVDFLNKYCPVFSRTTVEFFTGKLWEQNFARIDQELADEILKLSNDDLAKFPSGGLLNESEKSKCSSHDAINNFLREAVKNRLSSSPFSHEIDDFLSNIDLQNCGRCCCERGGVESHADEPGRNIGTRPVQEGASAASKGSVKKKAEIDHNLTKQIMGMKKSHEVAFMAHACSSLAKKTSLEQVFDIGSGKGYLGQFLALHYGINVISVDSSETNTKGATLRTKKLTKKWNGIVKRFGQADEGVTSSKYSDKNSRTGTSETGTTENYTEMTSLVVDSCSDTVTHKNRLAMDCVTDSKPASDNCLIRFDDGNMCEGFRNLTTNVNQGTHKEIKDNETSPDCGRRTNNLGVSSDNDVSNMYPNQAGNSSRLGEVGRTFKNFEYHEEKDYMQHANRAEDTKKCFYSNVTSAGPVKYSISKEQVESACCHTSRTRDIKSSTEDGHFMCVNGATGKEGNTEDGDFSLRDEGIHRKDENFCSAKGTQNSAVCVSVTGYVDEETEVSDLLQSIPEAICFDMDKPFMMVGLHTCGDLAPSMLRIFVANPSMHCLVNVGCCYHFVTEEFARADEWDREHPGVKLGKSFGFPMSRRLREKEFALGRTARMTACLSAERLSNDGSTSNVKGLFYRALLQVIMRDHFTIPTRRQIIGRLAPKCKTFLEYCRRALQKLKMDDTKISDEEIQAYEIEYREQYHHLLAYNHVRAALAPSIEALLLLDRVLYLREQPNISGAYIVQLFDPVTSPRCYAIIATKKTGVS